MIFAEDSGVKKKKKVLKLGKGKMTAFSSVSRKGQENYYVCWNET